MKRHASAVLAALALVVPLANGSHAAFAAECSGAAKPLGAPVATGSVDDGQTEVWTFTVPPGQQGLLNVQPLNGDADIYVCSGTSNVKCYSHNMYPVADGCHFKELSVPDPLDETGPPIFGFGAPLKPGDYRLSVHACFSSKDPGACDYADVGRPETKGLLDPAPAVQYVVTFTTQAA